MVIERSEPDWELIWPHLTSPYVITLAILFVVLLIALATVIAGPIASPSSSAASANTESVNESAHKSNQDWSLYSPSTSTINTKGLPTTTPSPWTKIKAMAKFQPHVFIKKLPRRFWNFFIDAFLIPSYRPEWGKYRNWSYKLPDNPQFDDRQGEFRKKQWSDAKAKKMKSKMTPEATPHDHSLCKRIKFNVNGTIYVTQLRTVLRFPDSLLGNETKRAKYYDPDTDSYFFDRNPASFEAILFFFQSGGFLRRPENVHLDIFYNDAEFYELPANVVNDFKIEEGVADLKEMDDMPKNLLQRKIWLLFDYPESSIQARILAIASVFVIVLSISMFCVETIPEFAGGPKIIRKASGLEQEPFEQMSINDPFFFTETICSIWFTIEIVARFASSPDKLKFSKSLQNIIDLVSVFPYYLSLITHNFGGGSKSGNGTGSLSILRVIRLVRVFRIFKLSRHSRGLKILGLTLKASISELFLLVFFVFIGVIIFSSCLYFAELTEHSSDFTSIPNGFWFTVITMTTVGYGDAVPKTFGGKVVGSICAITGVLTIALPVPVIVSNFNYFYHQSIDGEEFTFTRLYHVDNCPNRGRGGVEETEDETETEGESGGGGRGKS